MAKCKTAKLHIASNDLCEELAIEIFSRLPSRSLLRFRSVSKWLCACIDSPTFTRLHTLRSPKKIMIMHRGKNNANMYTLHSKYRLPYASYIGITPEIYPFKSSSCIVGSCNGIICVYDDSEKGIILWNPSIRRKVIVQYPPGRLYAFRFGFGFEPILDDYKIFAISRPSFVYTLKSGTWREISSPTSPFPYYVNSYQRLFNGALHCVTQRYSTNSEISYHMIKFDLSSEVFSTFELPELNLETRVVTVIDGSLAVIYSNPVGTRQIWVMRECNNTADSWSVAFKLNTNLFDEAYRVFQVTTNGDILAPNPYNKIAVYNPKTHMQSTLVDLSDSSSSFKVTMCTESLELLNMGTPC